MVISALGYMSLAGKASGSGASIPSVDYKAVLRLKSDELVAPSDIFRFVAADPSLPYFGRPLAEDTAAICRELSVDVVPNSREPWHYDLTAGFKNDDGDKQEKEDEDGRMTDNPLLWRDEIDVSTTQYSEPLRKALYMGDAANQFLQPGKFGHPVVNSAGTAFDPLPEVERDITCLRITKHQRDFDSQVADAFLNSINNDNFVINKQPYNFKFNCPAFWGKIKTYDGTFCFDNGIKYWRVNLELWKNPRTWLTEILDEGLEARHNDPENIEQYGKLFRLKDDADFPFTAPQLLDGNGNLLPKGAAEVFLRYCGYDLKPYGQIRW